VAAEAGDVTAVFVHIPRTGGMSISKALQVTKHRNRRRLVEGAEYSGIVTFGHELLLHLQRRGLAPKEAFTFAFCRNPYDRAISLWAFNNKRNGFDLSFREFCLDLGKWGWRIRYPQARWVDGVALDFLGRFETLQADFERLCILLGVERKKALPHLNQTEHEPYRTHYDDVTQAIVRSHYARDFERFGYTDDYLSNRQ
jgi:hypothetical protein